MTDSSAKPDPTAKPDPITKTTRIIPIFVQEQAELTTTGRMTEILRVCKRLEASGVAREQVALDLYNRLMRHFRP
jgi:hypothetical protein